MAIIHCKDFAFHICSIYQCYSLQLPITFQMYRLYPPVGNYRNILSLYRQQVLPSQKYICLDGITCFRRWYYLPINFFIRLKHLQVWLQKPSIIASNSCIHRWYYLPIKIFILFEHLQVWLQKPSIIASKKCILHIWVHH